jgi:hypothetical protein
MAISNCLSQSVHPPPAQPLIEIRIELPMERYLKYDGSIEVKVIIIAKDANGNDKDSDGGYIG